MSSPDSSSELKAGHPPAVKAGGMRITQHKVPSHDKPPEVKKTEGEEEEEEVEVTPSPPKQQLIISGVPARGDADFPTEAVQAFHNKPLPSHDYRQVTKPNIIHQPRK
ncbi:death-associated protein 1-like [Argiope bruennichi]|uniref:Death-associated protein 1 like protein n=1 Tax=Argiope bruennichi TaxID=94029 RepID=A0A8T0FTE6_ARGBR|nr:death-associated protein 1-like [Argiope bruennichi]KAF8793912.1 Death-associated protein 1 like protein [Argiope bruennichi]